MPLRRRNRSSVPFSPNMSADTLILPGSSATWTGTTFTFQNATNPSFIFESFANYPKLVRLTVSLPSTFTATTTSGVSSLSCVIPIASLPSWAQPASVTGSVTSTNTTGGSVGTTTVTVLPSTTSPISVSLSAALIYNVGGNQLQLTAQGFSTGVQTTVPVASSFQILYQAK